MNNKLINICIAKCHAVIRAMRKNKENKEIESDNEKERLRIWDREGLNEQVTFKQKPK